MLEIDLEGRVAVVSGGSRGIGLACVEKLALAGARVVIGFHDPDRGPEVDRTLEELERLGTEGVSYCGDLTDPDHCRNLIDLAQKKFGALHILVNNAGVWRRGALETLDEEGLLQTIDLNLKAAFRLGQRASRLIGKQPRGGSIIQIASTAGERGEAYYSHYAATKGALIAMVKSLARELAPRIRVNAVSPGWVETEMTQDTLTGPDRKAIERGIPLGRVGQPEDIAHAVAFLASDLSAWTTGAVLGVNGGGLLVSPE